MGKMSSHFTVAGFGKSFALTPQGNTDSHGANVASRTARNPELLLVAKLAVANLIGPPKCDGWFVQSPSKFCRNPLNAPHGLRTTWMYKINSNE